MQPLPPRGLVLVRNTVLHDARVLREAEELRDLGLDVLVAGVLSTVERARELELNGQRVIRLDPGSELRTLRRRLTRGRTEGPPATPGVRTPAMPPAAPGATGAGPHPLYALARRLVLAASYYRQGARLAGRLRPALVHANDYNTMWIGIWAKLRHGSKLIYDTHELWPDRNGRPEWRPWLMLCEALFVRVADVTITTSPGYAVRIAQRYRVPEPRIVRNIPRRSSSQPVPARRADGPPVLVYVGGLLAHRGLEQAIDALPGCPEVRLRLIGPAHDAYRSGLIARAQAVAVGDRVEIAGPVAPGGVIEAIASADAGLMLIQPTYLSYALTLPNKLFEYAAAALPILASDLPVIGAVVREEGLGEVVPPRDLAAIAEGMRRIVDPARNRAIRDRVRAFARRETWERERERLREIYRSLLVMN